MKAGADRYYLHDWHLRNGPISQREPISAAAMGFVRFVTPFLLGVNYP